MDEVFLNRGVEALEDGVVEAVAAAAIETSMPTLRQRRVNTSDVYCEP